MADNLVELTNISKLYGAIHALDQVDFCCKAGDVHAVLGENGAGKSTLMKLLAGVIQPSSGSIKVNGRKVSFASPRDAAECGIVCMFQELSLMPHLSVGDNIILAKPTTRFGFVAHSAYKKAQDALNRIDAGHISLKTPVNSLPLSERQLVEIAKALYCEPRLLMLDEATSALTEELTQKVFQVVRELRDQGVGILFISHHMTEVDAISDHITVFRNGRYISTFKAGSLSHDEIIGLMIGRSLSELFPARPPMQERSECPVLQVRNLNWDRHLTDINMEAYSGEIIGLGGLDGQGQQQFLDAVFGVLKHVDGEIILNGESMDRITPDKAKQSNVGLALVPEDRKNEGLIMDMSIADNLGLVALDRKPYGLIDLQSPEDQKIRDLMDRLALKFGNLGDPVSSLSGGNQQKIVLIKWLALSPRCVLLTDPTRGIDIRTKAQIYSLLRDLANEGLCVILQSTDHEELVHLCDRVYVFYGGTVNRELSGALLTAEQLISASMNIEGPEDSPTMIRSRRAVG